MDTEINSRYGKWFNPPDNIGVIGYTLEARVGLLFNAITPANRRVGGMSGREGPGIIFGIRGCCNTRIPHLQLKQAEAGEREAGGKQSLDHR